MKLFKWILLGAVPAAFMGGCTSSARATGESGAVTAAHVAAGGHRLLVMKPSAGAKLRFVSHKQAGFTTAPSIDDSAILLNVAAAFTLDTETLDVCGDQVVAGERIAGYDDVTAEYVADIEKCFAYMDAND